MKGLVPFVLGAIVAFAVADALFDASDRKAVENETKTRRIATEQTCKVLVEAKLVTSCGLK